MPRRITPFITQKYYHIFNRSLFKRPIFRKVRDINYFLGATAYYRLQSLPVQYSKYSENRSKYTLDESQLALSILGFVVMPTHFHFVVQQRGEGGLVNFIKRLTNSFSHFYNIKYAQRGPVFESNFKAVHIDAEEQLMHVLRYVDLNPVTAHIINDPLIYHWSSFPNHIGRNQFRWIDNEFILENFSGGSSYHTFVKDNQDYQRSLEKIKHLILE
ncbi:hypothetical protein A2690_02810 [Candidatus Roizmanbacteria bacterium RIFCSPHIGHO2_01_FULL_39_12b]|uniref:Transposase IS200-like domain-containing protein n=1 Tax=Candidatus Roizmanbacteria bacterium RIFCSPHIGHO2_01_FULL_39_12b TaxID=1802030 RepID=A0A1F7GCM2_9BACT|nr:MAG: hypothetical protein A2690_02810 [Candidatus Roizmanbacteria bacterium RIFCSPHIGHO2_01_FULL_39_12b]